MLALIRRLLLAAATAALVLCAAPAAQASIWHSCGKAQEKVLHGSGLVYYHFAVTETSCRRALDIMRAFDRWQESGEHGSRIQGWRVEEAESAEFSAWNGRARFYCFESS
jgi:hypothetical protein